MTTVVVALIAAAGLSTMAYTVPGQRALAWGGGFGGVGGCGGFGGCGGGFFDSCGFGCGGGFFVHKTIIQTIHQVNNCTEKETHVTPPPPPPPCEKKCTGDDQNPTYNQDQNQKDKRVVCLNTAVNSAGRGFDANANRGL
jgi:hypothetical protein